MTNEEAFLILLETIMPVDKENEALEKALEALRKQIPEKPIIERQDACFAFWCPGCNNLLINKYNNEFIVGEKEEFCEECGQRIDWSEEK